MKLENGGDGDLVGCASDKLAVCRGICVVALVCVAVASCGHSALPSRRFEDPSDTAASFDSVTVDQETGDVYLTSTSGAVYRLTEDLRLIDVYRGPSSTARNGTTTRLLEFIPPTSPHDDDDDVKKTLKRRKLLLRCETDLCVVLDCSGKRIRPVSRLDGVVNIVSVNNSSSSLDRDVLLFVPDRQPSLVNVSAGAVVVMYSAVVAQKPVDSDTLAALVLTNTVDNFSSLSSSSSSSWLKLRYLAEQDGGHSSIRLHVGDAARRVTQGVGPRSYVHAFDDGRFAYFVVVQTTLDGGVETRLARVCIDDAAFQSYTELVVLCRRRPTFQTYFKGAVTAVVAPMGETLARRLGERVGDDFRALYIAMGNPVDGYGLCVYPLADVRHEFTQAQRDCYRGSGRILAAVDADEPRCTEDVSYSYTMHILFFA